MGKPPEDARETSATVLVCEDEAVLRELIRVTLGPRFAIVEAEDGDEALELARCERPDVVLVDLMLPRLNGVDLIRALRAAPETAGTRIVVVSAWREAEDEAVAAGADRFVPKPFDPAELEAVIEELIA